MKKIIEPEDQRQAIDHILYIWTLGLVFISIISAVVLSSPRVVADTVSKTQVRVSEACTMSGTVDVEHEASLINGTYSIANYPNGIGKTTLTTMCNDGSGFAIYAIGYTGDTEGNNTLVGTNTGLTIPSGTLTSGSTSQWAMKLAKVTDATSYGSNNLTLENGYGSYSLVPSTYTKVASYSTTTDRTLGSKLETTYAVYISQSQASDTYNGQVKYLLVHPSTMSSISSTGITAVFQAYPGTSIAFADGSTENTVVFRQVCSNPSDSSTCTFMVTDGEYKNPVGYKGAWIVPLPDGQGGYSMELFEIQNGADEWILGLNDMDGSAFLGQTVPIYAYSGDAVIYDGNGATGGDMTAVASRFDGGEATLIAPNYYKTGYGFAGWSTSNSATPTNGATIYGPNATVSESDFSYDEDDNVTMYAVWVASSGNMQSFTCSSLSSGGITALTDTRDGSVYTVGKLADGNCWMMENLRLKDATLTASNTNNPLIASLGSSQNSWCTDGNSACINQSIINTNNISNSSSMINTYSQSNGGVNSKWYGYGNYYNWYAATAGNGTYEVDSDGTVLAGDICPSGWHLPSGTSAGEFADLSVALGGLDEWMGDSTSPTGTEASGYLRAYPNNFLYSGYWFGSSADSRSSNGYYWSRTAYGSGRAYVLDLYGDFVNPGSVIWNKVVGLSVRCLQSGS